MQEYKGRRAKKVDFKLEKYDTFNEYQDTPHGRMKKLNLILNAWKRVFEDLTTEEDHRRSKICASCPHAKSKKILQLINDDLVETKGMLCDLCGCPLSAKIRSEEICEKWNPPIK